MIKDRLKEDSVVALKDHNSRRVEILRFLISLIDKREMVLPPGGLTEAEELNVLRKELKNKEESRNIFEKGGRSDLVVQIDEEIAAVKEYLPQELDELEVSKLVDEVILEMPTANFGQIMGVAMKKLSGKAGGDVVSRIVKDRFSAKSV